MLSAEGKIYAEVLVDSVYRVAEGLIVVEEWWFERMCGLNIHYETTE